MRAFASGFALAASLLGGIGAHFVEEDAGTRTSAGAATQIVKASATSGDADVARAPTPAATSPAVAPIATTIPAEKPGDIALTSNTTSPQAELLSVNKIWSEGEHNAFTDLVRHNNAFYCVFREAKAHVAPDGGVRVLTSVDGEKWESAALVTRAEFDLRDPKIAVLPDGRLMLTSAGVKKGNYQTLAWHSQDGREWGEPVEIGEPNMWLWRVTWNGSAAFGVGYATSNDKFVRLYRSADGAEFEPLVANLFRDQYPNEASLVFLPDETALCLLRRDAGTNTAQLGTATPPYEKWTWRDVGRRIAAPNMIRLEDGRILAAGRSYTGAVRTSLLWLDPATAQLTEFLKLPSGGDCGCPGIVMHDGLLWVSYYASHEGRASIYFAKVRLPPAG